jgi:hypothetical protein
MDFSQLQDTAVEGQDFKPEPPPVTPGRVLYCDADFLAYHCGYRYETEALETSIENLKLEIETLRIMAGAEMIELHLTLGDKGGRYEIATVKEYQAQRQNKPEGLVERVGALRNFMSNYQNREIESRPQLTQEADDSLCQAMIAARDSGTENKAVLWSLDKDLWMVPGLHMDPKTYELEHYPNGYGECHLDRSGSSAKIVGCGHSFFWHQMLMGDTADNIPGLPRVPPSVVMKHMPSKKLLAAQERYRKATTPSKLTAARIALRKVEAEVKPRAVGSVLAYDLLKGCRTNREAFRVVRDLYAAWYTPMPFTATHWDGTQFESNAGEMMLEQGRLLWMRRYYEEDVLTFFKEVME